MKNSIIEQEITHNKIRLSNDTEIVNTFGELLASMDNSSPPKNKNLGKKLKLNPTVTKKLEQNISKKEIKVIIDNLSTK